MISKAKIVDCGPFRLSTMSLLFDRINDESSQSTSSLLHGRSSPRLQRAVSPRHARRQSEAPVLYDVVLKVLLSAVSKDHKTAKLSQMKNLIETGDIKSFKECAKINFDELEP